MRICDIPEPEWRLLSVLAGLGAGYLAGKLMDHLRWSSYTTKCWGEELDRKYREELTHGKDQGSQGQESTQETGGCVDAAKQPQRDAGAESDDGPCDRQAADTVK